MALLTDIQDQFGGPRVTMFPDVPGPDYMTRDLDASHFKILNLGAVEINPAAATTNKALRIVQTGPTSGNQNQAVTFNTIDVTEGINTGTGASFATVKALAITHNFGGPNVSGARYAATVDLVHSGGSSPTNSNRDYVAFGVSVTTHGDGGTDTGSGALGAYFGHHVVVQSEAVNLFQLSGAEIDISLLPGGSVRYRWGWSVTNGNAGTAALNSDDGAYQVGSGDIRGSWKNALLLSSANGAAPLATDGTVIGIGGGLSTWTIATGIDLSPLTITGNFLKGPGGFVVTGAGRLTSTDTLKITGANICTLNLWPTAAPDGRPWGFATARYTQGDLSLSQASAADSDPAAGILRIYFGPSGGMNISGASTDPGTGQIAVATKTPATAGAAGITGVITWDGSFLYVCTATNTWKRAAIATW